MPRLRGGAAQRDVEQREHREGEEPPDLEHRGHAERDRDARGDQRVVADDEVPEEARDLHTAGAVRGARRRRTNANDARQTNASTPGSEASPPGQRAPAPSADQKMPNVVSITPTANFIAFSGTRASGARTATPTPATTTTAPAAPTAASGMLPCVLPNVSTMNATSSPSRSTPLNESRKP